MQIPASKMQDTAAAGHIGQSTDVRGRRLFSLILLPIVVLSWISLIILLGGISAATDYASDISQTNTKSDLVSMTWVILVYFLFVLVFLTFVVVTNLRWSGLLLRSSKILLFSLAILIAWMGITADTVLKYERALDRTKSQRADLDLHAEDGLSSKSLDKAVDKAQQRTRAWCAGLIMCLICACLLAASLLAFDFWTSCHPIDKEGMHPEGTGAAGGTIVNTPMQHAPPLAMGPDAHSGPNSAVPGGPAVGAGHLGSSPQGPGHAYNYPDGSRPSYP